MSKIAIIGAGITGVTTACAVVASPLSEDNRWVNAQRIEVSGGQVI
jgi:uncharacterized NAD(P)/FAD-binding protein YdhS